MGLKLRELQANEKIYIDAKLDLPEKPKVRITISGNFSKLLDEVGEIEVHH